MIKIEATQVYGLGKAIVASGNSYKTGIEDRTTVTEKDIKRAKMLGVTHAGEGHDQFLTGIVVEFNLYAPLYMWKQLQRYGHLTFVSSESTMHTLLKFDIDERCGEEVNPEILALYKKLLENYKKLSNNPDITKADLDKKWKELIASLPSGFVLGATMVTNYRQLKTIYNQRKNHRLSEWHDFCKWCETLPKFKLICLREEEDEEEIS